MFLPASPAPPSPPPRPLSAWLAGQIDWPGYSALAARLATEATPPGGRNPTLVIFELQPCITIGRLGSRADVGIGDDELRSRQMPLRFTGRGGGAIVHGPGQVCISLFAALTDLGLTDTDAGRCLERFEAGLAAAVRDLRAGPVRHAGVNGIFGRTGLLAAVGLAIRHGVVAHGGFLNVGPALDLHHRITTLRLPAVATGSRPVSMGSIEADIQRRVRLQDARTALVRRLADAFGFEQAHVQSGFPVVPVATGHLTPGCVSRVG